MYLVSLPQLRQSMRSTTSLTEESLFPI
ncbi:Bgt-50901 [Blumeria graminis f. sp. tritici]|uniref:Bgt-50901 n=1 Tax=Blumeria graminis f. sp. tritici TaxID=62690 RepID=A0A9X9MLA4_BLUGR|nr:Bgt-50901 [Blumeria graminis f. sp. tritici]